MKVSIVSEGTRNIIVAIKKHSIERLIVQSAHGAAESAKEVPLMTRLAIRGLGLKYAFEDKDRMERIVRESGLLWTIVRPTRLTDEVEKRPIGRRSTFMLALDPVYRKWMWQTLY